MSEPGFEPGPLVCDTSVIDYTTQTLPQWVSTEPSGHGLKPGYGMDNGTSSKPATK